MKEKNELEKKIEMLRESSFSNFATLSSVAEFLYRKGMLDEFINYLSYREQQHKQICDFGRNLNFSNWDFSLLNNNKNED